MPYHVKSTGAMGTGNIYYEGGDTGNKNCWTQTYADRKVYSSKSTADAQVVNYDGSNGGFVGATVVSE